MRVKSWGTIVVVSVCTGVGSLILFMIGTSGSRIPSGIGASVGPETNVWTTVARCALLLGIASLPVFLVSLTGLGIKLRDGGDR